MNINANPIGQDRYASCITINFISRSQAPPVPPEAIKGRDKSRKKRERERIATTVVPLSSGEVCRLFALSVNLRAYCFVSRPRRCYRSFLLCRGSEKEIIETVGGGSGRGRILCRGRNIGNNVQCIIG